VNPDHTAAKLAVSWVVWEELTSLQNTLA